MIGKIITYNYGANGIVFTNFNQFESIKDTSGQTIASYTYDEAGKRKSTTIFGETVNYYYYRDQVLYKTESNFMQK